MPSAAQRRRRLRVARKPPSRRKLGKGGDVRRPAGRPGPDAQNTESGPVRTCVGCGSRRPQRELTRFGVNPEGAIEVDRKRRLPGRGAYLCGAGCLTAALKRKAFGRAFRGKAGQVDPSQLGQAWEPGVGERRGAGGSGC
ncbi:YlxR family protein [Myxococcus hansupus]|uniref:YlxR family protein n=1 Tax=Pseudomyxococcus hansupus TaxID=1297742 RepID=UPI001D05A36F|nr:YlxR family RNase P modulator [Myxococcus hansupus]